MVCLSAQQLLLSEHINIPKRKKTDTVPKLTSCLACRMPVTMTRSRNRKSRNQKVARTLDSPVSSVKKALSSLPAAAAAQQGTPEAHSDIASRR